MKYYYMLAAIFAWLQTANAVQVGPADQDDSQYPLHKCTSWYTSNDLGGPTNPSEAEMTVTAPAGIPGQWHFMQVLFYASQPTSSFYTYTKSSNWQLSAVDSFSGLQSGWTAKMTPRASTSVDFSAMKFPTEIHFSKVAETMTFSFKNAKAGTWKVKARFFYLKKPTGLVAEIPNTKIVLALNGLTTLESPNSTYALMGGQDYKLKIMGSGTSNVLHDKVQILDNEKVVGSAVYIGSNCWTFDVANIQMGWHDYKAYFLKNGKYVGWTPVTSVNAYWYSLNVAFGVNRNSVRVSPGTPDEIFFGDRGGLFGKLANAVDIPEQSSFPTSSVWKYGWMLPTGAAGPPVSGNSQSANVLYDNYCNMHSNRGVPFRWQATVPPGKYRVKLTAGDAVDGPETYKVLVEGKEVRFDTVRSLDATKPGWHDQELVEVQVDDGTLTLEPSGSAARPKLNFVQIRQIEADHEIHHEVLNDWNYRFHYYNPIDSLSVYPLSGQTPADQDALDKQGGFKFSNGMLAYTGEMSALEGLPDSLSADIDPGPGTTLEYWEYVTGNPFAFYGGFLGGSLLDSRQSYSYIVDAEKVIPSLNAPEMKIRVLKKSTGELVTTLPLELDDLANWSTFSSARAAKGLEETFDFPEYNLGFPGHKLAVSVGISAASEYQPDNITWTFTHRGGNPEHVYILETNSGFQKGALTASLARTVTQDPATKVWTLGAPAYTMLFAFSVDDRPELTVSALAPSFEGKPKPSSYYGTSPSEINQKAVELLSTAAMPLSYNATTYDLRTQAENTPAALWNLLSDDGAATSRSLNKSPELRTHTTLEEFVKKMNKDPLALANYVQNEIGLSDAIGYNQGYSGEGISIDPGGIQRGALGCFTEGQGSPHEQCALLVYLMRRAGVPAVYMKTDRNGLLMDSTVVSKMLMTNLKSITGKGDLVALNYPWVAVYLDADKNGTKEWTHLFPWIKDIEVKEGLDLYGQMPLAYNTGWKWAWQYMQGNEDVLPFQLRKVAGNPPYTKTGILYEKKNVFNLATAFPKEYEDLKSLVDYDQPARLFPRFVKWKLREEGRDISIDDIGLKKRARSRYYSSWTDFPKPTVVAGSLTAMRGFNEIPRIFDTIRYEVVKKNAQNEITGVLINSGDQLLCDLHNRKVYVERWDFKTPGTYEVGLVMAPYDSLANPTPTENFKPYNDTSKYPAWDANVDQGPADASLAEGLKGRATAAAEPTDGTVHLRIIHKRQRNNASRVTTADIPGSDFGSTPGLSRAYDFQSFVSNEDVRGLEYADVNGVSRGLFALCINTGRVTKEMLDVHVREMWKYENSASASKKIPDVEFGTRSYLMGMSYWQYMSRFGEEVGLLHKVVIQGDYGHLFAGLKYNEGDTTPNFPSIDIYRTNTNAHIYNISTRPEFTAGEEFATQLGFREKTPAADADVTASYYHLLGCQGSAFEHGVIERYYGQVGAISTMRVFHLAKAARALGAVAENNLILVNSATYNNDLQQRSIAHEIEGLPADMLGSSTALASFRQSITRLMDPVYAGTNAPYGRALLGPKYYKYFDNGELALECAGFAPLPADGGIMGGYIQTKMVRRRYSVTAAVLDIFDTTPPTYMGLFQAPVSINQGITQQVSRSYTPGMKETFTVKTQANSKFKKWEVMYDNAKVGELTTDVDPMTNHCEVIPGLDNVTFKYNNNTFTHPVTPGGIHNFNLIARYEVIPSYNVTAEVDLKKAGDFNGRFILPVLLDSSENQVINRKMAIGQTVAFEVETKDGRQFEKWEILKNSEPIHTMNRGAIQTRNTCTVTATPGSITFTYKNNTVSIPNTDTANLSISLRARYSDPVEPFHRTFAGSSPSGYGTYTKPKNQETIEGKVEVGKTVNYTAAPVTGVDFIGWNIYRLDLDPNNPVARLMNTGNAVNTCTVSGTSNSRVTISSGSAPAYIMNGLTHSGSTAQVGIVAVYQKKVSATVETTTVENRNGYGSLISTTYTHKVRVIVNAPAKVVVKSTYEQYDGLKGWPNTFPLNAAVKSDSGSTINQLYNLLQFNDNYMINDDGVRYRVSVAVKFDAGGPIRCFYVQAGNQNSGAVPEVAPFSWTSTHPW